MRKYILLSAVLTMGLNACNKPEKVDSISLEPVLIKVNLMQDSTIGWLDNYVLTSASPEKDSIASRKIMDIKISLLEAIEKQDSSLLESKLEDNFSFISGASFYSKQDFLSQRVYEGFDAKHFKLVQPTIQIVGNTAVLSYLKIDLNGTEESKSYWTDIFKLENNEWKLQAIQKF